MAKFNKKKLPSRHTSLGPDRAPHRSFYYAMGETEKDVAKPFVGVVSTWNEAAPCNIALMRQAQSVKKGVMTPFLTDCACLIKAMLQGAASFQVETTPTKGFATSFSVSPIA